MTGLNMQKKIGLMLLVCLVAAEAGPAAYNPIFRRHSLPGQKFFQESRQGRNSKLMQFGRSVDEDPVDPLSLLDVINGQNEVEEAEEKDLEAEDVSAEVESEESAASSEEIEAEVDSAESGEEDTSDMEKDEDDSDEELDESTEDIVKDLAQQVMDEAEDPAMEEEQEEQTQEERGGKLGEDTIGIHNYDMSADEEKDFKIKLLEDQLKQVRNILTARSNGQFAQPSVANQAYEGSAAQARFEDINDNSLRGGLPNDFGTNMGADQLADPDTNSYTNSPQLAANRQSEGETAVEDAGAQEDQEDENGLRCMKKIMMVQETKYEEIQKCTHSFTEKCHDTVITDYVAEQEEKCETIFDKNCRISYKPTVFEEAVNVCHEPLQTKCSNETRGAVVCKTHYETVCETRYKEHSVEQDEPECTMVIEERCDEVEVPVPGDVTSGAADSETRKKRALAYFQTANNINREKRQIGDLNNVAIGRNCEQWPVQKCDVVKKIVKKVNPESSCEKIPKEICAPSNCVQVKADKICAEEVRNFIQNLPEEKCGLEPKEVCKKETVMVPRLVPHKNCIKVPKEVCVNMKANPKKVNKPVVTEWCYDPADLEQQDSRAVLSKILRSKNMS